MPDATLYNSQSWAEKNFQNAPLGDKRRERRLIKVAQHLIDRPAASLPKSSPDWGSTKAAYRLFAAEEATLESVTQPHRRQVTQQPGRYLVFSDTTHVDFGKSRKLPEAGPVGPGNSQGFLLHSGLVFDADTRQLKGVGGQVHHVRKQRKGRQKQSQRFRRWRESQMWTDLFEQVGEPVEGAQLIHVCDSAADNFHSFATIARLGCDCVIRVGRAHRKIVTPDNRSMTLKNYVKTLTALGEYDLVVERNSQRSGRTARLSVRAARVTMPLPHHKTDEVKQWGEPIDLWVVDVREVDPPEGHEPIHWMLLTTLEVSDFAEAWEVVGFYEDRWLVEEWHKALKSGCRLQSRGLQSVDRLLPLTGVLSVVAVQLVQLKTLAREAPETPAREAIPGEWLQMLRATGRLKQSETSVRQFWRGVAKLGGFLGRKHDGEPGWQTLWSGWQDLHQLVLGARLMKNQTTRCG